MEARNPIQARIGKAGQAIARATRSDALAGLVGNDEQLRFVVASSQVCGRCRGPHVGTYAGANVSKSPRVEGRPTRMT